MSIEIIEKYIRHYFYSHYQAFFIDVELRGMPGGRQPFGFIADSKEIEETGYDLLIIGKIFSRHEGLER
jgi:hypothetical protein